MKRLTAPLLLLAALLVGCTVPTSSEATVIDQDQLPADLRAVPPETTTTIAANTDDVATLYFVRDGEAVLQLVERTVETDNRQQALKALFERATTPEEDEQSLVNRLGLLPLPAGDDGEPPLLELLGSSVDTTPDGRRYRWVNLNGPIDLGGELLTQAYAQIVFTATEGPPTIDFVQIRENGEPIDGIATEAGIATDTFVSRADYPSLTPVDDAEAE